MTTPRKYLREPTRRIDEMVKDWKRRPKNLRELVAGWQWERNAGAGSWTALEALTAICGSEEKLEVEIGKEEGSTFMAVPTWIVDAIVDAFMSARVMSPLEVRRLLRQEDERTRSTRVAEFLTSAPERDSAEVHCMFRDKDEESLEERMNEFHDIPTLDKAIDMQGRKRYFQIINEKVIACAVWEIIYTGAATSLALAYKIVALREGISPETVKKYYQAHRADITPRMEASMGSAPNG